MAIVFKTSVDSYAVGRRANAEEWNSISRTLEGSSSVAFGTPVQRGTTDHGCVAYDDGDFLGIAETNQVLPHPGDYYSPPDTVAICEVGVIGVVAGDTVAAGEDAGYDPLANSGEGGWVPAATDVAQAPGCQFETSGAAGTVVLVRIRRPVPVSA